MLEYGWNGMEWSRWNAVHWSEMEWSRWNAVQWSGMEWSRWMLWMDDPEPKCPRQI